MIDLNSTDGFKRRKACYPDKSRNISLVSKSVRHPLNVKPGGNSFLSVEQKGLSKAEQMGVLKAFPDELIMTLLGYADVLTLKNISHTSRIMYAFAYDEELWKKLYTERDTFRWNGTWRATVLGIESSKQANLQLPENLLCSDILYRPFQCSQIDYCKLFHKLIVEEKIYHDDAMLNCLASLPEGRIPRIQEDELSLDSFNQNYHDSPFILVNGNSERWPSWNLEVLLERFPEVKFRQEAVQWKLSDYAKYLEHNTDESPLYLFDCNSDAMKTLKEEYDPPAIFKEDLFKLFNFEGANCRPDHAWLIVGSSRSGSTFHKDPNYTSAWNTTLAGRKLWVMLPPKVTPPGVGTDEEESEVTSPVGIAEWVLSGFYNDAVKIPECLIGITFPGECMYVPSGWWHTVINLDDSVALTQNFVPTSKLPNALNFFKNKQGQISGFRPNQVKKMLEVFIAKISDVQSEDVEKLKEYRDKLDEQDLGNEDCGEIKELPPLPIFELFKQLMLKQGKAEELKQALEKLSKIEKKNLEMATGKSEKWERLTSQTEEKFSFGFNSEEDD